MTEREIQRDVLAYLKTCPNIKVWRNNSGRAAKNIVLAPKGSPDIIGFALDGSCGTFWGIEVKQPGKKQTQAQKDWEGELVRAGGYYFVVHSVEEAKRIYRKWLA